MKLKRILLPWCLRNANLVVKILFVLRSSISIILFNGNSCDWIPRWITHEEWNKIPKFKSTFKKLFVDYVCIECESFAATFKYLRRKACKGKRKCSSLDLTFIQTYLKGSSTFSFHLRSCEPNKLFRSLSIKKYYQSLSTRVNETSTYISLLLSFFPSIWIKNLSILLKAY